jgi:hypothetical protein
MARLNYQGGLIYPQARPLPHDTEPTLLERHGLEAVAESLFRLACACGLVEEPHGRMPFAHLGLEAQIPWVQRARSGPRVLGACEGRSLAQAAEQLYVDTAHSYNEAAASWQALPEEARLGWQALCHHLLILMDSDDEAALEEVEALALARHHRKLKELNCEPHSS